MGWDGDKDKMSDAYYTLLEPLAVNISQLYPGWRMRIYHNVTDDQPQVLTRLCRLYCNNPHVDLCDARRLPASGNLNDDFPVGRFWRFQVVSLSGIYID